MARLSIVRSWNANQDVMAIWTHIARHSPSAADRVLRRIDRSIARLAVQPNLGEQLPRLGDSTRRIIVGNYLVFYEVRPDLIFINRILHAARNWEELL